MKRAQATYQVALTFLNIGMLQPFCEGGTLPHMQERAVEI